MNDEETAPEYVLSVLRNHYPEERISKIANRALLAKSFVTKVRQALDLENNFGNSQKQFLTEPALPTNQLNGLSSLINHVKQTNEHFVLQFNQK